MSNKNAGIYIRLSEVDDDIQYESKSESVSNQRVILTDYVKKFVFNLIEEYIDEGYSGTNFNRPAFKKILEDVTSGKIDTIIVKDLFRLGRDHIDTGYFIENTFLQNNIRFISITEKLDSANLDGYNDSVTFVLACNDFFSQQNYQKIRIASRNKMKAGKFVGSQPPYGYMRDPEDKGHLIPDPLTAATVKRVFNMVLNGKTSTEIADLLNSENIITPSIYRNYKGGKINSKWSLSSIKKILNNELYTGDMVQGKGGKLNYKSEQKIKNSKSEWIIVENTYVPLVSKEKFIKIQKNRDTIHKPNKNRDKLLLENLMTCKDCGSSIYITVDKKRKLYFCDCSNHSKNGPKCCKSQYVTYYKLEKLIIDKLLKKGIITLNEMTRDNIIEVIDRIFIDKEKFVTIILKDENNKPLKLNYSHN